MKIIRWFLGKIILAYEALFSPSARTCTPAEQAKRQAALDGLTLYQYEACPFCVKVRFFLKRVGISLPIRDAKAEPYRAELMENGGKLQVPCLKIEEKNKPTRWMYESSDIIAYLESRLI